MTDKRDIFIESTMLGEGCPNHDPLVKRSSPDHHQGKTLGAIVEGTLCTGAFDSPIPDDAELESWWGW